jgi:hypothetical protein
MLDLYSQGYNVVVPSRYMSGGQMIGGPFLKRILSSTTRLTLCWFRGMPTRDAANSFKLYDAEMLHAPEIETRGGFEISLEITAKHSLQATGSWRCPASGETGPPANHNSDCGNGCQAICAGILYAFRPRFKRPHSAAHAKPNGR